MNFKLENGSRVAIVGGGPAGSFMAYFLLDLASRVDLDLHVDVYEPKDYTVFGPRGCNHCGGIVSESLVQHLATEGINIPNTIIKRGINSYVLHMDVGSVMIKTPTPEKRIVAMFRGAGPIGKKELDLSSFDGYLQNLSSKSGARILHEIVNDLSVDAQGFPVVGTRSGTRKSYDLLVGAGGIGPGFLKLFEKLEFGYVPPKTTKAAICEFRLTPEIVREYFGDSMHVFLLDVPRLKFAALIPKEDFVTLVLLGEKIDKRLLADFISRPEIKACFPSDLDLSKCFPCMCFPSINFESATGVFTDRIVLIGDSATTKLYKNGIGAAYFTAKAAATTAILHGVSATQFKKHYWPACQALRKDNAVGKRIFSLIAVLQRLNFLKRGILRVVDREKSRSGKRRGLSLALWDTFTGSASYTNILKRLFSPFLLIRLVIQSLLGQIPWLRKTRSYQRKSATDDSLGVVYPDGHAIIHEGAEGDCMYVIQAGRVQVIKEFNGREVVLAELGESDFFGEMALFEKSHRSTTVRARGEVRVLTIEKKTLLKRIQQDPTLAFRILSKMSGRLRDMDSIEHNVTQPL